MISTDVHQSNIPNLPSLPATPKSSSSQGSNIPNLPNLPATPKSSSSQGRKVKRVQSHSASLKVTFLQKESSSQTMHKAKLSIKKPEQETKSLKAQTKSLTQEINNLFIEHPKDLQHQLCAILQKHPPKASSQEVQVLLKSYLKEELDELTSNDVDTVLRTTSKGTSLWVAYTSSVLFPDKTSSENFIQRFMQLTKFFEKNETTQMEQQRMLLDLMIDVVSDRLKKNADLLAGLASINQFICQKIQEKTKENAEIMVLHAMTLQCIVPPITNKDRKQIPFTKYLTASFRSKNYDISGLLNELETLLISGNKYHPSYYTSLRQAIANYISLEQAIHSCEETQSREEIVLLLKESCQEIVTLLNQSSKDIKLQEAAWPVFCYPQMNAITITNLITKLMSYSKESNSQPLTETPHKSSSQKPKSQFLEDTPGALFWRLYVQKILSPLIPIQGLEKEVDHRKVDVEFYWVRIFARLMHFRKKESKSLEDLREVNKELKPFFITYEQFLEALVLAYFSPPIMKYAQDSYPGDANKQKKFRHFIEELRNPKKIYMPNLRSEFFDGM